MEIRMLTPDTLNLTPHQQAISDLHARRQKAIEAHGYRADRQIVAKLEIVQQALRDTFMPGYKLTTGAVCARRLLGKRCTGGWDWCKGPHLPPGQDHTTFWVKANAPSLLITQPYAFFRATPSSEVTDPMVEWAAQHGLTATVDPALSWWNPGATTLVMFTSAVSAR